MKIGFFSPYLETLGGGERYMMTAAQCLLEEGHEVDVFWNRKEIKDKLERRFNLSLGGINFVKNIFDRRGDLSRRWQITKSYDGFFYFSDGSLPFLFTKRNIIHFQVPLHGLKGKKLLNKIKLKKVKAVVCNSKFTKKIVDQEYGIKSRVIYPPIDIESFQPGEKENLILSVGRFSRAMHPKKQEVLIEVFKKMIKRGLKNWRLVLVGGVRPEEKQYLKTLRKKVKGYPIKILDNIKFIELKELCGQAKIFWHAAGYGEDEEKHPERAEHFGIAIVEGMAAGCTPVVINRGGIPEIVTHQKDGLLWETKKELTELTLDLIKKETLMKKLSTQAIKRSQRFSQASFCRKINEIFKD